MSNVATTIEQSKHLLELGLSKETADMSYSEEYFGKDKDGNDEWRWQLNACNFVDVEGIIPAWSLSELLEVMPSFIDYKGQKLRLTIEKAGVWNVFYIGTQHRLNEIWFNGEYGDSVEPAYKMVCWLLEQGFIKKGGNDDSDVH